MIEGKSQTLGLYIIEEQRIFNSVYKEIFPPSNSICLLGITNDLVISTIKSDITAKNPDILFFSIKGLDQKVVDDLRQLRNEFPRIGLVISFISYNTQNIMALRKITSVCQAGMALLLKQSLDRPEQLLNMIKAVGEGQVILDSVVTNLMFKEIDQGPIKGLTPRERRIMDLIARGYTNSNIAKTLYIDIRTVQHHINNIYSKLKEDPEFYAGHPRVSAARLYLETTGELLTCGVGGGTRPSLN